MHDLTTARKSARTDEDAAAIAWAQDEIERLQKEKSMAVAGEGFYELSADERTHFASPEQADIWDQDTGKPGIALFGNAIQVWSILNGRKSVADAAVAFNCSPQMVAAAVKHHYWMLLVGRGDDFSKVFIEHDGE